ncbi:MAG: aspartate aminotransferase family protein [Anaerolineales bacterium]|nr:aspartate aminotransferase family protein [Candidatus Brocadiales bacterium]MBL6983364.1 aspartate aminotransferase family protein [Anaerolineales bacterium]
MTTPIIPFYKRLDKVIVKAKDCLIYDSEGNQYIDFESGDWAANLGHSNDRIIKVIQDQIELIIHDGLQFRNKEAEDLSVALLEILRMPGGQSVFLNSGSEAVNLGITLAKFFTKRNKVLKIDQSFISAYGHGQISVDNERLLNIPIDKIDAISQYDFQQIAAFVFEPGNSKGLIQFPTAEFVETLAIAIKKSGCLLIANEVTTGFGRTGKWFASQHYTIKPDIIITGKGLGNGYPISAVSITDRISIMFEQDNFRYAQSHQNDPLGFAIGLAVIKTIQELGLIKSSLEKGEYFREALNNLQSKYPEKIKETRARGLMLAIEFHAPVDVEEIYDQLLVGGFITGIKNKTLRFMPPLVITKTDIDKLINSIDNIL